jgi:hypothetical protein
MEVPNRRVNFYRLSLWARAKGFTPQARIAEGTRFLVISKMLGTIAVASDH